MKSYYYSPVAVNSNNEVIMINRNDLDAWKATPGIQDVCWAVYLKEDNESTHVIDCSTEKTAEDVVISLRLAAGL